VRSLRQLFPYWEDINADFRRALAELGPEELAWVPPGGLNGIGPLAAHVARVYDRDVNVCLRGGEGRLPQDWRPATACELIEALAALHADLQDYLARTGPDDLDVRATELLWNVLIEELHHRGQVFMLMRMLGRDPPRI